MACMAFLDLSPTCLFQMIHRTPSHMSSIWAKLKGQASAHLLPLHMYHFACSVPTQTNGGVLATL